MSSFILKFSLLALLFSSSQLLALEVPALSGPVVDEAQLLSPAGKAAIQSALYTLEEREGIQFQVLIINTLTESETLEGYSIKVVDTWKLGKKGEDRAALLLVAAQDRKMRIEVGRGLEGELTDLATHRILDEMKPFFKKGEFDQGIALGLTLMAQTQGAALDFQGKLKPRHHRQGSAPLILFVLFGLIFFLQFFLPRNGRGSLWSSSGRGGFGGGGGFGGSGGGGGWSGGGGGFSGGGSSGNW